MKKQSLKKIKAFGFVVALLLITYLADKIYEHGMQSIIARYGASLRNDICNTRRIESRKYRLKAVLVQSPEGDTSNEATVVQTGTITLIKVPDANLLKYQISRRLEGRFDPWNRINHRLETPSMSWDVIAVSYMKNIEIKLKAACDEYIRTHPDPPS